VNECYIFSARHFLIFDDLGHDEHIEKRKPEALAAPPARVKARACTFYISNT
jgi:hypothetical protein